MQSLFDLHAVPEFPAIAAEARLPEQRECSPIEALRDRNPVGFLQRCAEALAQRAADLKKLADACQPLYPTLSPEQKRRTAALTIFVLREMRNDVEHRRLQSEETTARCKVIPKVIPFHGFG